MNPSEEIESLIATYNRLTGLQARWKIYEYSAAGFLNAGFTEKDMESIVKYIIRFNKTNHMKMSLDLRIILIDHERSNDLTNRALSQPRKPNPAQQVVEQFRRFTEDDTRVAAKNITEVFKNLGGALS